MVRITTRFDNSEPVVPTPYGLLSPAVNVIYENQDVHWEGSFDYSRSDYVTITNIASESNTVSSVVYAAPTDSPTYTDYVPFVIQADFTVPTIGNNAEEVNKAVESAIEAATQKALEQEFWTGELSQTLVTTDSTHPNRWLASPDATDVTPTPGTPIKVKYGMALLERAIGDSGIGERGLIHAARDTATFLPGLWQKDDILLSAIGTPVIAGAGYPSTSPDGDTPSAGNRWMYATGPVTVRLGKVFVYQEKIQDAINVSNNKIVYRAMRLASVTWSNNTHAAVLVDLGLD